MQAGDRHHGKSGLRGCTCFNMASCRQYRASDRCSLAICPRRCRLGMSSIRLILNGCPADHRGDLPPTALNTAQPDLETVTALRFRNSPVLMFTARPGLPTILFRRSNRIMAARQFCRRSPSAPPDYTDTTNRPLRKFLQFSNRSFQAAHLFGRRICLFLKSRAFWTSIFVGTRRLASDAFSPKVTRLLFRHSAEQSRYRMSPSLHAVCGVPD